MEENEVPSGERNISSVKGRLWLMGIVFFFFLSAIATLLLISRNGAINSDLKLEALGKLAAFYLPIFLLMTAFYFGKRHVPRHDAVVPLETFVFTLPVVILWVLAPIFLLVFIDAIEDILTTLERLKPYGDSVTLVVLGYYFSKE